MSSIYSKNNPPIGFYCYAYLRQDLTPYYIGKGSGIRAWKHSRGDVFPPKDITRIVILESNLSEIGALSLERRYIQWYGRKDKNTGILRNKTDGGEGTSGRIGNKNPMPEHIKKRISDGKKGKKLSCEHKNNVSNGLKKYYDTHENKRKKKLKTPNGIFESRIEAEKFYNTKSMGYWLKKYPNDFHYLE